MILSRDLKYAKTDSLLLALEEISRMLAKSCLKEGKVAGNIIGLEVAGTKG